MGAWLTSSVTPPVVFCHPRSLPWESKRGGQVFSQHMSLTTGTAAGQEEGRRLFPTESAYQGFDVAEPFQRCKNDPPVPVVP